MNVVITMAGAGTRFQNEGYLIPKYRIEAKGKSLFEWSLLSLRDFWNEKFFFIVKKEDCAEEFIKSYCERNAINGKIIQINYMTSGQAETALLAEDLWSVDEALLVYNIDTYVETGWLNYSSIRGDGFIPCFKGKGNHWSFVRVDAQFKAVEVREKKRISEFCSIGAYYFSTARLYQEIYADFYRCKYDSDMVEKYIAPMYNSMIEFGYDVFIQDIPSEKIHVLGTPKELEMFRNT